MSEFQPIFQYIVEGRIRDLEALIRQLQKPLRFIKDTTGYTLIHFAVLNEKEEIINSLVQHEKGLPGTPANEVTDWINALSPDGYTAFHLAISKGNFSIVKLLTLLGADVDIKTPLGLGSLHLASQGDFAHLISYFSEIGLSVMECDSKGGTPLHWAAYMGAYYATSVLMALQAPINSQDHDGHTPLHLAVLSANNRVVRLLLLKGADRELKDSRGRTPMEIAKENQSNELIDMLKPEGILEKTGYRPLLKPYKRTAFPFYFVLCLIIVTLALIILFCVQCNYYADNYYLSYFFTATSVSAVLLMIFLVNSNPGYITRPKGIKLSYLYQTYKYSEICPDCVILRPARSRHCHYCDKCVQKFDHHCQWVNNCIGARNLGWFYSFISLLWISVGLSIAISIEVFIGHEKDRGIEDSPYEISLIVASFTGFLSVLTLIPISYLFITHTKNFCENQTTSERFSKGSKFRGGKKEKSCFVKNCYSMCCNKESEHSSKSSVMTTSSKQMDDYHMILEESSTK